MVTNILLSIVLSLQTGNFIWKSNAKTFSLPFVSALLATASYDTRILLWSTITGELLKVFAHLIPSPSKIYAGGDNGAFVRSVVFSKYDQYLISTCDDK